MNFTGLIISYLYVISILGIATLLHKRAYLKEEGSRKLVHILSANWWLIAMYYFDNYIYASIAPFTFIILNYISHKNDLVKAVERSDKSGFGTVYYAISLFILALITFSPLSTPYVGAVGILIMGYGDGLAALIGKRFATSFFQIGNAYKSLVGTVAMFMVSFSITWLIGYAQFGIFPLYKALLIACIATIAELFAPNGLDNLSVPLLSSICYHIIA